MIELLEKYAKLIVESGLNIQKDQKLVISVSIENYELARLVAKQAYALGAKEVIVNYNDSEITKMRYLSRPLEEFSNIPTWLSDFYNGYAKENAAFLRIESNDPEAYKGVDPLKLAANSKAMFKACEPYYDLLENMTNAWCIVGASGQKWANKVYPDMGDQEAKLALWQAIFKACKLDQDDPIKAWQDHRRSFESRVNYLNSLPLDKLIYTNSKSHIEVGINPDGLFAGGGSYLKNGLYNFPNMPTEEIFTSPNYLRVDGVIHSSLPLNYQGNLIEDFYFRFRDGRILDYGARVGYDFLREMVETDEGSHYLGEIALVPTNSPISNMKTLFYNTLFDENASCHFALGKGFSECIKGGIGLSKDELVKKGVNDSLIHVDFMVGTPDLNIVGILKDGKEVPIFINGEFAF